MSAYRIKQNEVDNGIFEALRLAIVTGGYLPDFTAYANLTLYNAAKAAIVTAGLKEVIDLYSVGGFQSRGELNVNNIVIDRESPKSAKTGVGIAWDYDLNGDDMYVKQKQADSKFDIPYKISYFCEKAQYADIIEELIRKAFGIRKYINAINDAGAVTGQFWLIYTGEADTSGPDFIERVAMYEARNIDLMGGTDEGLISPMTEFTLEMVTTTEPITEQEALDADANLQIELDISE